MRIKMIEGNPEGKRGLRERGISNLVVALILVAVAVVGGGFVFTSFYEQMHTMTRNVSLRAQSLDVVSTTSGDLVSMTVKNDGTVALDNVRVKVINQGVENVTLLVDHLSPGQTGSDYESGDWGFEPGETYPVLITAEGPGGEAAISRARSVRAGS